MVVGVCGGFLWWLVFVVVACGSFSKWLYGACVVALAKFQSCF